MNAMEKKTSNLSKEFILTTPASQLVERFCLGKKTEIQIFTTSCWILTIIQISFLISKAFTVVRNAPLKIDHLFSMLCFFVELADKLYNP